MFKKVLVANRGEIAVRIIRALKEMNIESVAIYSEADKDSMHVKLADKAVCVGPSNPTKSYLNKKSVLCAAMVEQCDAIHPGYGFLSENSSFVSMCNECGIAFIGPSPESIDLMGDKAEARKTAKTIGVPLLVGTEKAVEDANEAEQIANKIGYPIILKAAHGGGGKGMRIVRKQEELKSLFKLASSESQISFGSGEIYIEKYLENPRHIEIQILADKYNNAVYLGERECSLQRNHQKVIEESPSPIVDIELRKRMGEDAIKCAKHINYSGVGTLEFLMDKNRDYYFMEMNTRLQVEHGVTEMVTGLDLVKEQIKAAYGLKLTITQDDIEIKGHSIECRINAECPEKNFMPSPGRINSLYMPGGRGVRIDSAIYCNSVITPYYDSMIGKLMVYGDNREDAIIIMNRCLREVEIEGINTNTEFLLQLLESDEYISGNFDTGFVQRFLEKKKEF